MAALVLALALLVLLGKENANGYQCQKLNVTSAWTGRIISPGYPQYGPNLNCSWLIEVADGNIIEATITALELSSEQESQGTDSNCSTAGDFVALHDGDSENAGTIAKFCGNIGGQKIRTANNRMLITFQTDATNHHAGFIIDYTGICVKNMTFSLSEGQSGNISSPGFPGNYLRLLKCHWTIQAKSGLNVNIWVRTFRLEKQLYCSYDYLSFYRGMYCGEGSERIGKNHCGDEVIPSFSNQGSLSICFESDFDGQDSGFLLYYTLTDIDECSDSSLFQCHHKAFCLNTYGSYNCVCKNGYLGDGKNCTRSPDFAYVDECALGTHNCHKYALCTDTDDEFYCKCKPGFKGNGTQCQDIDECRTGERICNAPYSFCLNSPGSSSCVCMEGFQGDGYNCTDIDECNLVNRTCHAQASCNNTIGSFTCTCMRGFTGNETYCTRLTRIPGATLGEEWQYIAVNVTHQNKKTYEDRDSIPYDVTVKHRQSNATDSYGVAIRFYLPFYLQLENCTQSPTECVTTLSNNQLTITLERLKFAEARTLSFTTTFGAAEILDRGFHHLITPIDVTWYDQYQMSNGRYVGIGTQQTQPRTADIFGVEISGCSKPLGMTDGRIKKHQLMASTSDPTNRPVAASPSKNGWCALKTDSDPFIQIILAQKSHITKILTNSRNDKQHWVISYEMDYSLDNIKWTSYGENGFAKLLSGNKEFNVSVEHWLLYPFDANHVRLRPKEIHVLACMRFELYGCTVSNEDNCVDPIGMESGKIPDAAITDDLMGAHNPPSNVRLNKLVTSFPYGWQASSGTSPPTYIQIDLGSIFKVTRFAIQGANTSPLPAFFVKSYQVSSSNTGLSDDWTFVRDSQGNIETFIGPQEDWQAIYPYPVFLPKPMFARYFRLYPGNYHTIKVMRMEIYGCIADPTPRNITVLPAEFQRRVVLLDGKNGVFYVCAHKEKGSSCFFSSDGKQWERFSELVVNVLAYNQKDRMLYGLSRELNYMLSREYSDHWTYITPAEWERVKADSSIIHATPLEDILVGSEPSSNAHEWTSSNGYVWGVSGKGIHLKTYAEAKWQLTASWKCCGQ